ncbi:hypothetical protein ACA910_003103 [Epithemia clementina (nom. ined.)]
MKFLLILISTLHVATAFFSLSPHNMVRAKTVAQWGYVPDGMTPEQYKKLKDQEKASKSNKKFGAFGPQSFKSRSLQSFQTDMEKGKAGHLMPVFNAKELLKTGKLKQEDIPYMQRGGSWDNSDVKTAKQKEWNEYDKKYNANQKASGLDWMGNNQRSGPAAKQKAEPPKKKNGWW